MNKFSKNNDYIVFESVGVDECLDDVTIYTGYNEQTIESVIKIRKLKSHSLESILKRIVKQLEKKPNQ